MSWQQKAFVIFVFVYLAIFGADTYREFGIVGVIGRLIIPAVVGGFFGHAIQSRVIRLWLRVHIIGGIKFLWCNYFHDKHRERTGERVIDSPYIGYEIRCKKCGTIDSEWVKPFSED